MKEEPSELGEEHKAPWQDGLQNIPSQASAGFNGQWNWGDSQVQMANSDLKKDPGTADLSFNIKKMLEWWEK